MLAAHGWNDRVAALWSVADQPGWVPGRVIRVDRGSCLVATDAAVVRASAYTLASRQAGLDDEPACGDWVAVVDDPSEGWAIVAVLPRWSAIVRRAPEDRGGGAQVLVANADVVGIVSGLDRPSSAARFERTLALVWEAGATPVIILTKLDVVGDADAAVQDAERAAPGVDVLLTSATSGEGVEAVRELAGPGRTLAFLGPSGAGKSTLINELLGKEVQATGTVRALDSRGRHTTVTRDLIPLAGGGVLVDTPGLRSLGLWQAEEGVAATFDDVEAFAAQCRFADCTHAEEPGCAVRAALESNTLDARRFESWQKLQRELASEAVRADVRARRAVGRAFGRRTRVHRTEAKKRRDR